MVAKNVFPEEGVEPVPPLKQAVPGRHLIRRTTTTLAQLHALPSHVRSQNIWLWIEQTLRDHFSTMPE
jgi:hypothetical protein